MKTIAIEIAIAIVIVIILCIGLGSYNFYSQGYRIGINSEWAKIYNYNDSDNSYRSWTISYSHGRTLNEKGEWINLWKWPSFYKCDTRTLLQTGTNKEVKPMD
jgi:hypothetical protein